MRQFGRGGRGAEGADAEVGGEEGACCLEEGEDVAVWGERGVSGLVLVMGMGVLGGGKRGGLRLDLEEGV